VKVKEKISQKFPLVFHKKNSKISLCYRQLEERAKNAHEQFLRGGFKLLAFQRVPASDLNENFGKGEVDYARFLPFGAARKQARLLSATRAEAAYQSVQVVAVHPVAVIEVGVVLETGLAASGAKRARKAHQVEAVGAAVCVRIALGRSRRAAAVRVADGCSPLTYLELE
jgi:hypothetical protein